MDTIAKMLKGGFFKIYHGAMREMVKGNHKWLRCPHQTSTSLDLISHTQNNPLTQK